MQRHWHFSYSHQLICKIYRVFFSITKKCSCKTPGLNMPFQQHCFSCVSISEQSDCRYCRRWRHSLCQKALRTLKATRSSLVCASSFLHVCSSVAHIKKHEEMADHPPAMVIYSLQTNAVARPSDSVRYLSYDWWILWGEFSHFIWLSVVRGQVCTAWFALRLSIHLIWKKGIMT